MMKRTRRALAALAVATGMMTACHDGTGSEQRAPARVEITSGDAQAGAVGTQLASAVVARVSAANGEPVSGQVVSFTVLSGGGSVGAAAVTTDASGLARTTWTLGGAAGEQKLEARLVPTGTAGTALADTARATATPGAAQSLTIVGSATRSDTVGRTVTDSLVVVVRDGFGNPVPGVTVTFTPAGGGSVSPPTAVTRADGTAHTAWTLGTTAGPQSVTASAPGVATPVTFTATAIARSRLQAVLTVPGTIVDVDATRVLWMNGANQLFVRDRAAGTDQTVVTLAAFSTFSGAFLTPYGVVYGARFVSNHNGTVYDWRGGTPAVIGFFDPEGSLRVKGAYAVWLENSTLRRRDLSTNTTLDVATNAYAQRTDANTAPDVLANGVVAYTTSFSTPHTVVIYDGSTYNTVATSTGNFTLVNPKTDGTNVVFLAGDYATGQQRVVLRTPTTTDTLVSTVAQSRDFIPYLVTNGWVAFGSPAGVFRRLASSSTTQQLSQLRGVPEALNSDGTLVFRTVSAGNQWTQYLAPPGGAAELLGLGTDTDLAWFISGAPFIASGGTLYRVGP